MADFAVIQTGGKQYKVHVGDKIEVEKLEEGKKEPTFETLLLSKEGKVTVGTPLLKSKVSGKIVNTVKGEKIHILKFKAKSRYRRHAGHRQTYSLVEITDIS